MTPTKVLRRLVEHAPPIIAANAKLRNRCIMATRIGIQTLAQFGIPAFPLPVNVKLFNKPYVDFLMGDQQGDPAALGCWLLECSEESTGEGWSGHLLIYVPTRCCVVDLDLQQFDRPLKQMWIQPAAAFEWPEGSTEQTYTLPGGHALFYTARQGDRSFEVAKDWQRDSLDIATEIATAMRKGTKEPLLTSK